LDNEDCDVFATDIAGDSSLRIRDNEFVELARARPFPRSTTQLLANAGTAHLEQDYLQWVWKAPSWPWRTLEAVLETALEQNER